jgi:hypothetical protein
MYLRLSLILSLAFLTACATPPRESQIEANKYLRGTCLQAFLGSVPGGFDGQYGLYLSQPLNKLLNPLGVGPRGYFAASISSDGKIACGWKTNMSGSDAGLSYDRLAEEALAKCNESRKILNINEPCQLFAKNMDVIYEKITPSKRFY